MAVAPPERRVVRLSSVVVPGSGIKGSLVFDLRFPNQIRPIPVGPPSQLVRVLGRIGTPITLLHVPPKNHNLSILR